MSEWKTYRLGDLIEINKNSINSNYEFDEIEYIDTSSVTENRFSKLQKLKLKDAPSRAKRIVNENDIVYSTVRPILRHYGIAKNVKPNTVASTGFAVICAKNINQDFLYYYLTTDEIVLFLNSVAEASTTTFPAFNANLFENIDVYIPICIEEQKEIASILTSLDNKIELNLQMNKTLETMAQAIFKEWFVDFNFPGFDGQLVDGLPKGWRVTELGEVSTLIAGGDKPNEFSDYSNGKNTIPIYSNGISDEGLYGFTNEPRILDESVTVSARGTIGFVCLRLKPYLPIVRLISVIPKSEFLTAKYLYFELLNKNITGTGTTQQQLTVPDFRRFNILIPDIETINEFSSIVNDFYKKIEDNKRQIQSLTQTRDTLLPKLMKGEIKL